MHPKKKLRNFCGLRQEGAVIHGWTFMKLGICVIIGKVAENLSRPMLISLSTVKRKSDGYQRGSILADGSSVPLLKKVGPPVDESRLWQSVAHPHDRRKPEKGKTVPRFHDADTMQALVWGKVCDKLMDIKQYDRLHFDI